jgi:hypothetical protein
LPKAKTILIAVGIAAAALVIIGILFASTYCACEHGDHVPQGASTTPVQNTPPPLPTACGPNPAPAVSVPPTEFGYRQLTSPARELPVSSPLRVAGQMNPFEGAFTVTIFDRQGRRVATEDYRKANTSLAFDVVLPFEVTSPLAACVWVHERSGRDGSATNITQVPVLLLP